MAESYGMRAESGNLRSDKERVLQCADVYDAITDALFEADIERDKIPVEYTGRLHDVTEAVVATHSVERKTAPATQEKISTRESLDAICAHVWRSVLVRLENLGIALDANDPLYTELRQLITNIVIRERALKSQRES